ncbi:MAG: Nif11-like leader peptide family natural product precursor [Nostoc sp.]
MALENVKAFYEKLANEEGFRNQIQGVNSKEECSQIVKAAGYDFTLEEYEEYTAQLLESAESEGELKDLSEKELAAVFGGLTGKHKIQPLYGVVRRWPPIIQPVYGVIRPIDIV